MSRLADHAPARMCQPYAAGSSPAASRCSAISAAFSSTDAGRTLLDRGGQAPVPLGAIGFQLRFVGHRADQRMAEGVLGARGEPHLIDQLRAQRLVEHRIDAQRGEQFGPEAGADHRRRVQRPLGCGVQPVDARLDGRLHRGRHADLRDIRATDILTVLAGQHPALHQLAHHLLGEKRIPGGPLGDDRRQLADRGIRPQQLAQQRRGVRITQRPKRDRLCAVDPSQRPLIFGAGGDQHHQLGLRNDGEEVGHHRFADRIDPMHILDEIERRFGRGPAPRC